VSARDPVPATAVVGLIELTVGGGEVCWFVSPEFDDDPPQPIK
jgi:hypothetical protein